MTSEQIAAIILEVINEETVFYALSAWAALITSGGVTLGLAMDRMIRLVIEKIRQ